MDFMNLHQAAHGDREFGFIESSSGRRPQDGRRALGGSARPGPDRRLGASGLRLARGPPPARRPLRRQHAPRRRHRGRQGRGADPARRDGQRLPVERADRGGRVGAGRRRSTTCWPPTTRTYEVAPELRRDGARRDELREAARIEVGLRSFLTAGGFGAFTDTFEDLGGLSAAAGHRRPAADGRRLRVRRRGRLEERRAGPPVQGDGERACRAGRRSWRTTPTTSIRPVRWSSARTCWRSVRASPPAGRRARSTRCRSAARSDPVRLVFDAAPGSRVRRGDDRPGRSLPDRGQRHRRRRSRPRRCPGSRSRERSGGRDPTCPPPSRRG